MSPSKNICFWAAISATFVRIESVICGQRERKIFGQIRSVFLDGFRRQSSFTLCLRDPGGHMSV
jgi:hypothetical protein